MILFVVSTQLSDIKDEIYINWCFIKQYFFKLRICTVNLCTIILKLLHYNCTYSKLELIWNVRKTKVNNKECGQPNWCFK